MEKSAAAVGEAASFPPILGGGSREPSGLATATRPIFPQPLTEEVLPVADAVVVANQRARRHPARRDRLLAQAQAGFMREAVGLARVHFAVGEHAVVPRGLATGERGTTWSMLPSFGESLRPVYWRRC